MRNNSRNAIRTALAPSMYQIMLVTSQGSAICSHCVRDNVHELISDLRSGYYTDLKPLCLAETDGAICCDYCGERYSEYSDLAMDPDEAEALEASESLYCSDSDLDGIY